MYDFVNTQNTYMKLYIHNNVILTNFFKVMKNKTTIQIILLSLFISLISLPYSLYSQEGEAEVTNISEFSPGWAIGIKLGTFGPGIELVKSINRSFNIRAGGNYGVYTYKKTYEDLEIDGEAKYKLGAITLLGDWFFAKKIHLTAGIYYNFSEEIIKGTPTKSYNVGKIEITPEEIGNLEIVLTPNKICFESHHAPETQKLSKWEAFFTEVNLWAF